MAQVFGHCKSALDPCVQASGVAHGLQQPALHNAPGGVLVDPIRKSKDRKRKHRHQHKHGDESVPPEGAVLAFWASGAGRCVGAVECHDAGLS